MVGGRWRWSRIYTTIAKHSNWYEEMLNHDFCFNIPFKLLKACVCVPNTKTPLAGHYPLKSALALGRCAPRIQHALYPRAATAALGFLLLVLQNKVYFSQTFLCWSFSLVMGECIDVVVVVSIVAVDNHYRAMSLTMSRPPSLPVQATVFHKPATTR